HAGQAVVGGAGALPIRFRGARPAAGGRAHPVAPERGRIARMKEAESMLMTPPHEAVALMARRFRGFLPVSVDVETGGFRAATDALLEVAAVLIDMDADGKLTRGATHSYHVKPFEGARLDPASLSITGIDPHHPLRPALPEGDALQRIFREVRHAVRGLRCRAQRGYLLSHLQPLPRQLPRSRRTGACARLAQRAGDRGGDRRSADGDGAPAAGPGHLAHQLNDRAGLAQQLLERPA